MLDDGEHLRDPVVHVADQVADGGHIGGAESQFARRRGLDTHLVFQPGGENPIAGTEFERVGVEEIVGHVEQAQPLGARTGSFGPGQHEMEDVLGGIAHVATGDEPLHALDVPGAVGLFDGFGAGRAHVGARIGFGEHHGGRPAALYALGRPPSLLFGALDVQGLRHEGAQAKEVRGGVGAEHHFGDSPCQRRRRGHATDLFGQAQPPPPGLFDRVDRLDQLRRHADAVRGGVEYRWVAVRVGESLGDRALGQAGGFGQNRFGGIDVEIAVASGAEDGPDVEDLEQVELEIADVGDVVAHGGSLRFGELRRSVSERGNVRNRNLR